MKNDVAEGPVDYDVVVVGGAFSGAATALLVKRWMPSARVLVIERQAAFDQKVGEATVEISAIFLHRVIGLYDELSRTHLPKHGLRYWFYDHLGRSLAEMTEAGPDEVPRLPAFQLDRAKIDERLLSLAEEAGAEIARPARVTQLDLEWPKNRVRFESDTGIRTVSARWVIDASGRAAVVARQLGLHRRVDELPTAAVWGRWSGIRDMDGPAMAGHDPRAPWLKPLDASRRLSTNHFCGYGWWCWAIPLGGGETSIGVVYDKGLFDFPTKGTALERYRAFLSAQPGLRELVVGATLNEDDFRGYGHLPYRTTQYAARGWALVGDAASFIDPYYSPGLDHASMSVYATALILEEDLAKRCNLSTLDARLGKHNGEFVRSYDRWLHALYVGKYQLMGDAELLLSAFLVDTALYYLAVVTPVHKDVTNLKNPILGQNLPQAKAAYQFMAFFNRRLQKLAEKRRAVGTYGKRNAGWHVYFGDVGLGSSAVLKLVRGLGLWGRLEVDGLLSAVRAKRATSDASHSVESAAAPRQTNGSRAEAEANRPS
jgi:flavin-dependent dehydrogenase